MKLHLATVTMLLMGLNADAQKKTWLVDVNGYLDYQKNNYASLNNWQIDLTAGKQIAHHWAAGLFWSSGEKQYLKLDTASYNTPSGSYTYPVYRRYSRSVYKFGMWGRYVCKINKRFFFYTQVSVGLTHWSNEDKFPGNLGYYTPLNTNGLDTQTPNFRDGSFVNITPAIAMTISHGFGVHASVGGIKYEHSAVYGFDSYNRITVDFSKQFSLGIQKIINTKKSRQLAGIEDKKTS